MVLWKSPLCRTSDRATHVFTQPNPYDNASESDTRTARRWIHRRKGQKLGVWRRAILEHLAGCPPSEPCQLGRHVRHHEHATSRSRLQAPLQAKPNTTIADRPLVVGSYLPWSDGGKWGPSGKGETVQERTGLGHLVVARLRRC